jgi:hypothetical protein
MLLLWPGPEHRNCSWTSEAKLKRSVFWDGMLCSLVKVNRRFGGTYLLHLQDSRVS